MKDRVLFYDANEEQDFAAGAEVHFTRGLLNMHTVAKIRVGIYEGEDRNDWLLDRVVLTNEQSGEKFNFFCGPFRTRTVCFSRPNSKSSNVIQKLSGGPKLRLNFQSTLCCPSSFLHSPHSHQYGGSGIGYLRIKWIRRFASDQAA